jgi:hypothetical protein
MGEIVHLQTSLPKAVVGLAPVVAIHLERATQVKVGVLVAALGGIAIL